jgi:hypothetical protein
MFKESALANLVLTSLPVVIVLLMALLLPGAIKNPGGYGRASIVLYGIGFASFAAAKIHTILKGHLISFGPSLMPKPWRWAYRIGYALMALALLLTLVVLVASR